MPLAALGLYIHTPFCQHKCGYCDFYSSTNADQYESAFVSALIQEIKTKSEKQKVDSIFLGGGTPSLLSVQDLERIMHTIQSHYLLTADCEITIETNPGTVNREKLAAFQSIGINRISFGVQSFIESELKFMERIHTAEEAIENIKAAHSLAFENVSFDLIYAIGEQTLKDWKYNLDLAISLGTEHISAYNLIIEKNTAFYRLMQDGKISEKSQEEERRFYEFTMEHLSKAAYTHYEVSNYAKSKNFESRHNSKYWNHDPYLAFGPSAHSFDGKRKRSWNIRSTEKYIDSIQSGKTAQSGEEELSDEELRLELIMLGFRKREGISLSAFKTRCSSSFLDEYSQSIERFKTMKLLDYDANFCFLTQEGLFYCNEIISQFKVNK